jgi:hypothetical protein
MAAPFIVPFNFQPTSFSTQSASYTVPAGKYVNAHAWFASGGSGTGATYTLNSATVNGNAFFYETSFRITRAVTSAVSNFTVPSNCIGTITLLLSNTGFSAGVMNYYYYNTILLATQTGTGSFSPVFGPFLLNTSGGDSITQSNTAVGNYLNLNYQSSETRSPLTWFPSGSILSGTGAFRWTIQEYNMIS